MNRDISVLIIGGGSIGQRHLKNLLSLGFKNIAVVETDRSRQTELKKSYKIEVFNSLELSLKKKWGVFFICAPTSQHLKIASRLVKEKTSIFMEKPMATVQAGISNFKKEVSRAGICFMVGYNLNFHPQLKKIKNIIDQGLLGKIWGARAEFGYYLPAWRPKQNYQESYSSKKRLGGGVILDDIHEVDYLYGLFGEVKKVFCLAKKISDLKIDTEDYAEATLWFKSGVIGQVHMDYLQRSYSRSLKIIGEKGSLFWDLGKSEFKYYIAEKDKWFFDRPKKFDFDEMYLAEVRYFFACRKNSKNNLLGIDRGIKTLQIALAMKQSAKNNKIINIS